jgi:nicotinate-nucleotide pyrophosphorylase (carboxylating)
MELTETATSAVVSRALAEDGAGSDLTTLALVPGDATCTARIVLEEAGVVAGLPVALAVFRRLDPSLQATVRHDDRAVLADRSTEVATLNGAARAILSGERTALNILGRLGGIATLTRRYVDAVAGTGVTILDTRKTTPGLRALEKYAVRCGGATNHRLGLDDGILVKENHLQLTETIAEAVATLKRRGLKMPITVEAETLEQVEQALAAGVERVLLDNMPMCQVSEAVTLTAGRAELEVSGGVTLANVRGYAETGVEFISVGALTHSARSLAVSLDIVR